MKYKHYVSLSHGSKLIHLWRPRQAQISKESNSKIFVGRTTVFFYMSILIYFIPYFTVIKKLRALLCNFLTGFNGNVIIVDFIMKTLCEVRWKIYRSFLLRNKNNKVTSAWSQLWKVKRSILSNQLETLLEENINGKYKIRTGEWYIR